MAHNHSQDVILVINAGSSSIKFSIFTCTELTLMYRGAINTIAENPQLIIFDAAQTPLLSYSIQSTGYEAALQALFNWLEQLDHPLTLSAVGHRVVHAGPYYSGPTRITAETIKNLTSLNALAPLHQPLNLEAINIICRLHPTLTQVACFDTTFHRTQDKLATLFAIPRKLSAEGIVRYGFHGLSYEYIASVLPDYIPNKANGTIIVAHLGHGASLCAMNQRQSMATSMGLSALDGLMMGTRCGSLDAGVILYLLQEKKLSIEEVSHVLYHESGLLGVSGLSSDMRQLEASSEPNAQEAIDLFCYRAASELLSLCAMLQGCDAIVFTAGIGENSALVRTKISARLQWLGLRLDESANHRNASIISQDNSAITVAVIPTHEEYMIAKHTLSFCLP